MGDVQAAVGFDRLPWLADEPRPRKRSNWRAVVRWAVAALLLVAAASYWMGRRSVVDVPPDPAVQSTRAPVTVPLPAPERDIVPQPEVTIAPPPRVEPVAAPRSPLSEVAPKARRAATPIARRAPAKPAKPAPAARPQIRALPLWPVAVEQGATGRLVRIGTFASRLQAKRGWARIMRLYPGMARLRALVVPRRSLRNGRIYYRLQMGTTSQAHSEVLCQRMRMIAQSCVVVDLPVARGAYR